MLERLKVSTKVQMGWGEVAAQKESVPVQVMTKVGLTMSLGELLYWALMGEGRGEVVGG